MANGRLSLRLFGGFDLRRADGRPLALPGRRERILLAYLAMQPERRRSRHALTEFLWGEAADDTTLDNLRTCLWSLRKALGDDADAILVSDREWIGITPDALDVDAWTFCRLAGGSDPADLEKAMDLYGGDLLDGIDIASDAFSDWLRDQQTRHRDIAVDTLKRLMAARIAHGDFDGAIETGQRCLRIEPYHEEIVRALLPIYAETGRRPLVLQTYRAFAERLEKDLGIAPEAETRRVLDEALNSQTRRDASENATAVADRQGTAHQPGPQPPRKARMFPVIRRPASRVALWASGALLVAALVASMTLVFVSWRAPELAPVSLAVLPFQGHGDADAGEVGDAISAAATSALAIASDIFVVSPSSVPIDPTMSKKRIADRLGVRYLLEGSVSKFGDSVIISVGLIDTKEGVQYLPIGNYQRRLGDIFELLREITIDVVTSLKVKLTEGEQERITLVQGTRNFDAWLLASKGEKLLRQLAPNTNLRARVSYEQAVALDPNYAGASIGLSWTYLLEARFGWAGDRKARIIEAQRIAERAMALDRGRAAAYSLVGTIALMTGDYSTATKLGERAVELNTNDPDGFALLAYTLSYTGEQGRAITHVNRAIRLRPYPPRWYLWLLARCHRLAGHPEEAIRMLTAEDAKSTQSIMPLVDLAAAYAEIGALAKAREVASAILAVYPQFSVRAWLIMLPPKHDSVAESELRTLVKAGLPE